MNTTRPDAMEPLGRLTKSGKLYEGNYPEWAECMFALLEVRYEGVEPDYSLRSPDTIDPRHLVLAEVSPTILSRLPGLFPTKAKSNDFGCWPTLELAHELVSRHLKKAAQHFKLMDLPIGLRQTIAELAISIHGEVSWSLGALYPRHQLHAITRVSRTLRNETLKPAWAQVRLCIEEYDSTRLLAESSDKFFDTIHKLLDPLYDSQHLSHLRLASLYIRVRRCDPGWLPTLATFQLRFSYSPKTGLDLEIPEHAFETLTPASIQRLKLHIKTVSQSLGSGSHGGGALVAALTAVPELWLDGNLQCQLRTRS